MAEQQYGIYYIEGIAPGAFKIYEQRTATMYLVCGTEKACLIDTAFGLGDLKEITEQLGHLPVTVVNTHGHSDHVLGNQRFYDGGNGRVCSETSGFMTAETAGCICIRRTGRCMRGRSRDSCRCSGTRRCGSSTANS